MRVLHVDPERAWGGGEVQVLALVSALAARGHASSVAAHPEGPLARAAAAAGARIIPLRIANHLDVRAALVRAGVRAERIRVVPSGIDARALAAPPAARAAVRREWGLGDDEVAVVALGALEVRKGHAVLLAAAAGLAAAAPRLRYVFCGEGRQAKALASAAAALNGAARLVGFRRDVAACLAAADIVALPSFQEGLGVAALEAMAAGRPVVASRVGGLAEAVVHEETGLLVPPGDPTALAAALARLARDPDLRARLGAAGRARVLARYTATRMAEGTLACYEDRPCA